MFRKNYNEGYALRFMNYNTKIPVIAFSNGMFVKDSVKYKGIRTGVTRIAEKQTNKNLAILL